MFSPSQYQFHSVWVVHADRETAYNTLADYEKYPQWWPQVRTTEPDGEGVRTEVRSFLPYSLNFTMYDAGRQPGSGILIGRIEGDLDGFARWTVTPSAEGVRIVYDQTVTLRPVLLRRLGILVKPAFRVNHRWMMHCGQLGLRKKLET